jgi:hypothetical protein
MTCDECVKDVSGALYKLQGITRVEAKLGDQIVLVEGTGNYEVLLEHAPFVSQIFRRELKFFLGLTEASFDS